MLHYAYEVAANTVRLLCGAGLEQWILRAFLLLSCRRNQQYMNYGKKWITQYFRLQGWVIILFGFRLEKLFG